MVSRLVICQPRLAKNGWAIAPLKYTPSGICVAISGHSHNTVETNVNALRYAGFIENRAAHTNGDEDLHLTDAGWNVSGQQRPFWLAA